jgi:triphosphoribosyl-dephospho-CoA synthetase
MTENGCRANREAASTAASLILSGMKVRSISWAGIDRMMICGRCGKMNTPDGTNMQEAYSRVRDEIMADITRLDNMVMERHDPAHIRMVRKEKGRRWREKNPEWSKERQRLWRLRKKAEKEREGEP